MQKISRTLDLDDTQFGKGKHTRDVIFILHSAHGIILLLFTRRDS